MSVNLLLSNNSKSIYSQSLTLSDGFAYPDTTYYNSDDNADYTFIDAPNGTIVASSKNIVTIVGSMVYFNINIVYQKPNNNANQLKFIVKDAQLPAYPQIINFFVTLNDESNGISGIIENINDETVIYVVYTSAVLDAVTYDEIIANGIIKISGCYFT